MLATVLNRDLHFEGRSDAQARAEMSPEYVEAFFRFFSDGEYDDSRINPTVQPITGKPSHTFVQWSQTHAQAFRDTPHRLKPGSFSPLYMPEFVQQRRATKEQS